LWRLSSFAKASDDEEDIEAGIPKKEEKKDERSRCRDQ
jgi:hypothetical protein